MYLMVDKGRAKRENIWLKDHELWPRAKYFSIWPDLAQSVIILLH